MRNLTLFLIFIFILPLTLRAEEQSLTLDEAIVIALRDNRDILLKTEDIKKAKKEIAEAEAGLFPALNFIGSWTNTAGYYSKNLGQAAAQADLKQYLYKGGRTINTISQNKYKLEVSHSLLDKAKLELILNVKKAFYTLLLTQEFTSLNKGILENTQEHLNLIKERYKIGQASESDILNIEASLKNIWEVHQASLNQLDAGGALLNNLLYLNEDVRIKPNAQFTYEAREVAYDEAFLKALSSRPEIKQYYAQIQADKKAIEIAKADNRPSIYASWDYYSHSHAAAAKGWNDYNVIGLTFSWPIFDGWLTKAKVEQAIIGLKETQLTKEKAVKDIALELKTAYISLKNAVSKLKSVEADCLLYKNNLSTAEEKYRQGQVSLLDKDDMDLKYKVSVFNKKQAVYDYIIAKGSFDKATGGP